MNSATHWLPKTGRRETLFHRCTCSTRCMKARSRDSLPLARIRRSVLRIRTRSARPSKNWTGWSVKISSTMKPTNSGEAPALIPRRSRRRCFLLPAAATMEKEGSQSNSGRWVQWKYKAAEAPGDALPVGEIEIKIMAAVKKLYAKEGGPNAEAILNLKWDYTDSKGHYRCPESVQTDQRLFPEGYGHRRQGQEARRPNSRKASWCRAFGNLQDDGSDGMRQLGHVRKLRRGRREQDGQARQGRSDRTGPLPQLGLCLAGQPPHHLQPRILRCEWQALQSQTQYSGMEGR